MHCFAPASSAGVPITDCMLNTHARAHAACMCSSVMVARTGMLTCDCRTNRHAKLAADLAGHRHGITGQDLELNCGGRVAAASRPAR